VIAEAQTRKKILEGRLEQTQGVAAKARPADLPSEELKASELTRELVALHIPVAPRLIADDISPERVATLLHEHGGRMALLSAEGTLFELMAGRYSNSVPNFDIYLKGHAGDTIRVDRVKRAPEYVDAPGLSVGITIQPDVLRALSTTPGFRGRGLLGRFLYTVPPSRPAWHSTARHGAQHQNVPKPHDLARAAVGWNGGLGGALPFGIVFQVEDYPYYDRSFAVHGAGK